MRHSSESLTFHRVAEASVAFRQKSRHACRVAGGKRAAQRQKCSTHVAETEQRQRHQVQNRRSESAVSLSCSHWVLHWAFHAQQLRQRQARQVRRCGVTAQTAALRCSCGEPSRGPSFAIGDQEAEGRERRDGCVAGDRQTLGRAGGELSYFLRQPPSSPLCLRCFPWSRTS